MTPRADIVAQVVLTKFDQLPPKRKPSIRQNGLHEWIPLSAIVAERDGEFHCLALATGMKCLPASKIPNSNGIILHDWHAEILAIRTFNRYLLDECLRLLKEGGESTILDHNKQAPLPDSERETARPFKVRSNVKLHMYCSEAPCGDASMELTMTAQDDATPWEVPAPAAGEPPEQSLPGREFFSRLGVVRRKPGRRDAPPTLSKSCSDKLALKQCTSLLSSITSLFIEPQDAYIDTLIVPASQYTEIGYERSFSARGRMKPLEGCSWQDGFSFKPFSIDTTELEFSFSKKNVAERAEKLAPSPVGAAWSSPMFSEPIVGGILQGKKPSDIRGASRTSRRQMWLAAKDLADQLGDGYAGIRTCLGKATYGAVKSDSLLACRGQVTASARNSALTGWVRNQGDSDFCVDLE